MTHYCPDGCGVEPGPDTITRGQFATLINLLQAWMAENARSPLDGTRSCRACGVMMLETHHDKHQAWHRRADT